MNHINQEQDKGGHSALFGLAIAGALAAGIGLFLRSDKGHEMQEELKTRAKDVAQRFKQKREELQEKVKDVFGELSDELETTYLEVQGKVLAEVHSLKKGVELTQDKFSDLVDEAVDEYSKSREWASSVSKKLKVQLKKDWKDIQAL